MIYNQQLTRLLLYLPSLFDIDFLTDAGYVSQIENALLYPLYNYYNIHTIF